MMNIWPLNFANRGIGRLAAVRRQWVSALAFSCLVHYYRLNQLWFAFRIIAYPGGVVKLLGKRVGAFEVDCAQTLILEILILTRPHKVYLEGAVYARKQ
jgi:hypothetical protein